MPAYKTPLETRCIWDRFGRCKKRATHEVFNRWNESRGTYCTQHANAMTVELNVAHSIWDGPERKAEGT